MADKQLEEVIAIAIQREEEAIAFYQGLYSRVQDETAKDTLAFLAGEEKKHKEFLLNYRAGKYKAESLADDARWSITGLPNTLRSRTLRQDCGKQGRLPRWRHTGSLPHTISIRHLPGYTLPGK